MKTNEEKDWRVFARLAISLLCASGTGLLFAVASYFITIKLMPAGLPVVKKNIYELPTGQIITIAITGIVSGVAVLILMTRTFVLRTITD